MPRFRTKIHEVEAIQLRHPVTVPSSDSTNPSEARSFDVPAGTWLVVDTEGSQSYVPDEQFTSVYEPVPSPPRRGRPPGKVTSIEGEVTRKRHRRKRHKQAA